MESNRVSSGNAWNRWRLVLGKNAKESLPFENANIQYVEMGNLLDFLYSRELGEDQNIREGKLGGNGGSQLTVPEWIRRVRDLFPKKTVEVLEKHALDTYGMTELVTDKEVLEKLEPNTELLKTILTFKGLMRPEVLESARRIVRTVAEDLQKKMEQELRKAISGHLDRRKTSNVISARNLDIAKTIRRNLKYYYSKFLLERYLNNYSFKKKKYINSIDKFYRDREHVVNFKGEKLVLKRYFNDGL